MKDGIFAISSPLQVINTVEAIGKFQIDNYLIVVLMSSNHRSNAMIQMALNHFQVKHYIIIPWKIHNYVNYIRQLRFLKKSLRVKKHYTYVFIGDYRVYIQLLFPMNFSHEKFYLIDDGTVTLTMQEKYLNQAIIPPYIEGGLKNRITRFIAEKIFRLKTTQNIKPNLFTMFDIKPHPKQLIVANNFEFLNSQLSDFCKYNESVIFLGSNMYANNVISFKHYADALGKINTYFKGKTIDYIPHRGEPEKMLDLIKSEFSFRIMKTESIVELEFLRLKMYPQTIASFFSTGLFTLKKIFQDAEIVSFKIDSEYVLEANRERIDEYYRYYAKYINVIDLEKVK